MKFKDYYKILGLQTSKVTLPELKIAYREAAKKSHPDVNVGNNIAEERFKDINEAYRILSDPITKKKYDRIWNSNVGRKNKQNNETTKSINIKFTDFFTMFFGNLKNIKKDKKVEKTETSEVKGKEKIKGENIETQIDLKIEETFYGCSKKISLRAADGKMKTFDVKIPAGIRDSEKVRLLGQGKKGINGGKNGDLLVRINIEDSKLKLRGINLYTDLYITPWEAALGTKAKIDVIDDIASVHIPQGIASGEKVRIQGKGYKDGKGGRGDLIAEVKIMVPKELTEKEKDLYTELSKVSSFNPRK